MSNGLARSAPHIHRQRSVAAIMHEVACALIPGIIVAIVLFGWGVLIQCLLAYFSALLSEALILKLRRLPLRLYLADGSALLTALLLALTLSPLTPWWLTVSASAFAIIIVKHVFGGIGQNLFNPAMAGYVFVILCFPAAMNVWPDITTARADLPVTLNAIFTAAALPDAVSGATPLAYLRTAIDNMVMIPEIEQQPVFGLLGGRGWEWLACAWLLGGVWLWYRGIIKWRIPLSVIAGCAAASLLFYIHNPDSYASPLFHLFSGGLMLGAFFIATDPVTAASTPRGRLLYGAGIGILTYLIRTFGGYPDGMAFAVLIMNAFVPLIDQYTRPPVVGEQRS